MLAALLFTITLPPEVLSENVFLQYCLYTPNAKCSWVSPRAGMHAYKIETRAALMKTILYAPGCKLDAFTVSQENPEHKFVCVVLPTVSITGDVIVKSPDYAAKVTLEATYSATWAKQFFGVSDIISNFTIVQKQPGSIKFDLSIPDFASDPRTASGSIYLWWHELATGKRTALLVPFEAERKIDSLKVQSTYPSGMTFMPCSVDSTLVHDKVGFAVRSDLEPPCWP